MSLGFGVGRRAVSKELFIASHEILIERYLESHPNATEAEAYDKTADLAYNHMTDRLADMADMLRQRAKDGQS
jgi:hypothetical protein